MIKIYLKKRQIIKNIYLNLKSIIQTNILIKIILLTKIILNNKIKKTILK